MDPPATADISRSEIDRLLNSVKWFHIFEVLPGVITPGEIRHNPRPMLDALRVPEDLSGLCCLDIGAWDGPTAFEMERRGGNVVALDIQDPGKTGFNVAKQIKNSTVEYIQGSVYDLARILPDRKFDLIAFFGVYYHLKYPIMAFEQIAKIMKDGGTLVISGEILRHYAETLGGRPATDLDIKQLAESEVPLTAVYPGRYKDGSNWHVPNLACLKSWLIAAGLELTHHFIIDNVQTKRGLSQAFRGRARRVRDIVNEHPLVGVNMWNSG